MSEVTLLPAMHEEAEKLPRRTGGPRERLSEARAKFVRIFARTGLARYAAEQAGYSRPETEAARLRADPNVIKAVLEARESFIVGELGGLAYAELKHLITDRDRTPPSVRFAACRWVPGTAPRVTPWATKAKHWRI
jgi:hypothetical protein